MVGDKVLDLTVDGRAVPSDSISSYKPVIQEITVLVERARVQARLDREQAERDRKRAAEDRAIMQSIVDDLVKDGLVSNKESIHSLKVNADEFLLNGKPLPKAVQKKYIAKYVTGKGYSLSYHNED